MSNTLHRLRTITRGCLWLSLAGIALAAHAEPMLKLTWTVNGDTRTQTIALPQPGKAVEVGKVAQRPYEPTSGDCSGVDTSAIARSYPEGDALLVRSSVPFEEGAFVDVKFESVRYAGIGSTSVVRNCTLQFASTRHVKADPRVFLKFGQSTLLHYARDEDRVTRLEAELLR